MSNSWYYNNILSPKDRVIVICGRIVLVILFVVISAASFHRFLYPTYDFNFLSHIDSLANTISRPVTTHQGTRFDIAAQGDFTTAQISITLASDAPLFTPQTSLSVTRSYAAFLAPIDMGKYTDHFSQILICDNKKYLRTHDALRPFLSENVANSHLFSQFITPSNTIPCPTEQNSTYAGFRSGTLISSSEGIYVTDGEVKRPIQDEMVFQALGYDFDNVIAASSEERSLHKKARMITLDSSHPFGTIFYTRDTQRTYIYDQNTLHSIPTSHQTTQNAIVTEEASRTTSATCTLTKKKFSERTYTCKIPLDNIADFPGNIFRFVINVPSVDIARSHIKLSTAQTHSSLEHRLTAFKKQLLQYYGRSEK